MNKKAYLSLNISDQSLLAKKINSFRQRYDPKYYNNPIVNLALFQPIMLDHHRLQSMEEEIADLVDDFFGGINDETTVRFTGLECLSNGRQNILFLKPELCSELSFFRESVIEIARGYQRRHERKVSDRLRYMPIGRFHNQVDLINAISVVKSEFNFPMELPVRDVSLNTKSMGVYQSKNSLFQFTNLSEKNELRIASTF